MKKLMVLLIAGVLSIAVFAGCSSKTKFQAVKAEDVLEEHFGFCITKGNPKKDEILGAMNKVIKKYRDDGTILKLCTYYQRLFNKEDPGEKVLEVPALTGSETLVVYTNAEFAPYEFVYENKIVGVDMDLMGMVAAELGMKLEIRDGKYDQIFTAVPSQAAAGTYHVGAAGITITEERKETLLFSDPYVNSIQYIICAEGASYKNIGDLKGLRIGVQQGTTGDLAVDAAINEDLNSDPEKPYYGTLKGSGAQLIRYDSGPVAFLALMSNTIDVVVLDELPAKSIVANQ